jgi:hypothetical protein
MILYSVFNHAISAVVDENRLIGLVCTLVLSTSHSESRLLKNGSKGVLASHAHSWGHMSSDPKGTSLRENTSFELPTSKLVQRFGR